MKIHFKSLIAAFAVVVGTSISAQAATVDFVAEANNNGERAEVDGTQLNIGGFNIKFSSSHFTYFDKSGGAGPAGLGVCQNNTNSCGGDDNVTTGESVTLMFDFAVNLSGLSFTNAGHNPVNGADTLRIGTNLMGLTSTTFAAAAAAAFNGITSITFAYDDGAHSANQFYVNKVDVERDPTGGQIPLPAGLPLLLAGLGVLGVTKRLKKA